MNIEKILDTISNLARCQGYYSRLYTWLLETKDNDPEEFEKIKEELESQKFKDSVDLVMYFET